jgi:hypothetical protein
MNWSQEERARICTKIAKEMFEIARHKPLVKSDEIAKNAEMIIYLLNAESEFLEANKDRFSSYTEENKA